ncbi:unnamed protein product [Arctogadus glacialis]
MEALPLPPLSRSLCLSPSLSHPPLPHQPDTRNKPGMRLFLEVASTSSESKHYYFFYPFLYQCCFSFSVPVSVYKSHNTDFQEYRFVFVFFLMLFPVVTVSPLELGFFVLFLRT